MSKFVASSSDNLLTVKAEKRGVQSLIILRSLNISHFIPSCVCVCVCFHLPWWFVLLHRSESMRQELDPYLWIFSGSEVSNEVSLRYVLLEDADHERWWFETRETMGFWDEPQLGDGSKQLLLPLSLGIWSPFDWCVSNGLKTPTRTSYGGVCSILYWIPKKFHNNHFLEQINSFQTCQPSGVFFIFNFRGIYLLRPHFSGCVVPFKKGDMKTSPVVVDQPWESWNVSTQGQVRSVASTLDFPENFEGSKPEKRNWNLSYNVLVLYIYIYTYLFIYIHIHIYENENLLNIIRVT